MAIDKSSLDSIPKCYATCSIGKPTDSLPDRLKAIASAGFQAIELSFPDLLPFASKLLDKEVQPVDYDDLCTAATEVKKLCEKLNLKILILQPFANFEGWPEGSDERKDAFSRADGWIRIMHAAGTDMLQASLTHLAPQPTSPHLRIPDTNRLRTTGRIIRFTRHKHLPRHRRQRPPPTRRPPRNPPVPPRLRELVLVHPRPNLETSLANRPKGQSSEHRSVSRHLSNRRQRMG